MSGIIKESNTSSLLENARGQSKIEREPASTLHLNNSEHISGSIVALRVLTLVVFFLGAVQYLYGIIVHSSLLSIQFAASVLAFCSSVEVFVSRVQKKTIADSQSVYLLYRTAGTVFFIACLFLNLTHCLEDISDIKALSAPHVNETEEAGEEHEHAVAYETLYISIFDMAIKLLHVVFYNALSIAFIGNFIALVFPSVVTILVFVYNVNDLDYFFFWLDHHIEPVTSILLTILCLSIAIYSLIRKKQFLLAEGPRGFSIDKISDSVKARNQSLEKVDHVHASCEWPEGFTVSLKAYIKVEKNHKNWVAQAATDFSELKALLHTEIKAQGAKEVIIEPVFVDRNQPSNYDDSICIDRSCHNEDVGCCTNPKPTTEA